MQEGFYEHRIRTYYADCDKNVRMKMSSVLHCLSDVAGIAYDSRGYDYQWLFEKGQVFLLSQVSVKMHHLPGPNEWIKVQTWEVGAKGAVFLRNYRILAEDDRLLAEAKTYWLLISPADRKVLRPRDFVGELKPVDLDCGASLPERLSVKRAELLFREEAAHTVRFSDLDLNNHVYNAKYADMVYDALPEEFAARKPEEFQIHFKQEAHYGEQIQIGYHAEENDVVVAGYTAEDKLCFTAKLVYASEEQ